jgi:hypothetical protein
VRLFPTVAIALAAAAGCASSGTRFEWSQVDALTPGLTTVQMRERIGKPNAVSATAAGDSIFVWLYSTGTAFGTGTGRSFGVLFDHSGRLVRVLNRTDTSIR